MKHIIVHVHDDGDTELIFVEANPKHVFITNDLIYSQPEIAKGMLEKELISYGHDADRVREAIEDCLKGNKVTV